MLFTSVNPACLFIVYMVSMCIERSSVQCIHTLFILYNVVHAACGDESQSTLLPAKKKRPLNTNEYDESKSLLLNNELEFWPLNIL